MPDTRWCLLKVPPNNPWKDDVAIDFHDIVREGVANFLRDVAKEPELADFMHNGAKVQLVDDIAGILRDIVLMTDPDLVDTRDAEKLLNEFYPDWRNSWTESKQTNPDLK